MSNTEELRNIINKLNGVGKQSLAENHSMPRPSGGINTVYTGPEGWVKEVTSHDAAQYLGRNTSFEFASPHCNWNRYYQRYKQLFIIYDKASKKRFAVTADGLCTDDTDRSCQTPAWASQYVPTKQTRDDTDYDPNRKLGQNGGLFFEDDPDSEPAGGAGGTKIRMTPELQALMRKYGV